MKLLAEALASGPPRSRPDAPAVRTNPYHHMNLCTKNVQRLSEFYGSVDDLPSPGILYGSSASTPSPDWRSFAGLDFTGGLSRPTRQKRWTLPGSGHCTGLYRDPELDFTGLPMPATS